MAAKQLELTVAQIIELNKKRVAAVSAGLGQEEVNALITKAKVDTADEANAYFLHAMMLAIQHLANGNVLVAGRAIDDALTHFLADIKSSPDLGPKYAENAAAHLMRNISLFLSPARRDMIMAALDV